MQIAYQLSVVVAETLCKRADLLQDGTYGRPKRLGDALSEAFLRELLAGHLGNLPPRDSTASWGRDWPAARSMLAVVLGLYLSSQNGCVYPISLSVRRISSMAVYVGST